MKQQPINLRAKCILTALVERYIRDGQPVASKTILADTRIDVSSATVRNIMVELEQAGYIQSPHTSAGRIPTEQGYRFFVDTLLQSKQNVSLSSNDLKKQLCNETNGQSLAMTASTLLSQITKLAGIVTLPRHERLILRHLEFLPLSQSRVLVILVLNEREVQNRIIYTNRNYNDRELEEAAKFIMEHFSGKDLNNIRNDIMQSMECDRQHLETWMQDALNITQQALQKPKQDDKYVIAGEANLLDVAAEAGVEKLQLLFTAFNQKQAILHLLDCSLNAEGLQIFIGHESGNDLFEGCSVITAPYSVEGETVGVLGVIGPTRMNYQQAIASVEITAQALSSVLEDD